MGCAAARTGVGKDLGSTGVGRSPAEFTVLTNDCCSYSESTLALDGFGADGQLDDRLNGMLRLAVCL